MYPSVTSKVEALAQSMTLAISPSGRKIDLWMICREMLVVGGSYVGERRCEQSDLCYILSHIIMFLP